MEMKSILVVMLSEQPPIPVPQQSAKYDHEPDPTTIVSGTRTNTATTCGVARAWVSAAPQRAPAGADLGRRGALGAAALLGAWGAEGAGDAALASGGSTAGKYSTIPSAKRRFYGRVRQGIYQFLQMERFAHGACIPQKHRLPNSPNRAFKQQLTPSLALRFSSAEGMRQVLPWGRALDVSRGCLHEEPIKAGNLQDPLIEDFFGKTIVKQVGGQQIRNCNFADCKTKEKKTSRWLDFKLASDLLASAFRYSADDVNDYLPQVKLIRSYAKKVGKLEKAIDNNDVQTVQTLYSQCKKDLGLYTGMVELNPLDSEDYTHAWDTRPVVVCQGTFCT
ncbi:unnamed protein product [Prorocentrum cordatum]|uniref:Uncharacterized protein n=1 Tax=Prorocentrum cordatum TaxID=2364126 RepID=A0ABN9RKE2_9DINO|nr:unnamed protein product [Polarella glacialis]